MHIEAFPCAGLKKQDSNKKEISPQGRNDKTNVTSSAVEKSSDKISCPKCKKGTILKGKTAYGCSDYKSGCDFVFTFENIKKIANGKSLTKEFVLKVIAG